MWGMHMEMMKVKYVPSSKLTNSEFYLNILLGSDAIGWGVGKRSTMN